MSTTRRDTVCVSAHGEETAGSSAGLQPIVIRTTLASKNNHSTQQLDVGIRDHGLKTEHTSSRKLIGTGTGGVSHRRKVVMLCH